MEDNGLELLAYSETTWIINQTMNKDVHKVSYPRNSWHFKRDTEKNVPVRISQITESQTDRC